MTVVGLFAGIGGFERAFADAGFETEMLVEIDPAASAVLRERFPGTHLIADVTAVSDLPDSTTIVTAGFPCQNLSMAGDKTGINGRKSGVVEKMFDLISRSRAPTVVIENVYFMLQLDSGRAMEWLVGQFEDLGYYWGYRVLDTMGFGLPHRRRRVYMVASREIDPRAVLFADEGPGSEPRPPQLGEPIGFYWTEGKSGVGLTCDGIPPLKVGSALGIPSAPAVLFPDGEVLMPSVAACERLQGFPAGWTDGAHTGENVGEENIVLARAVDNTVNRAAWRLVGNAVSVPVARWVAERIRAPGTIKSFNITSIEPNRRWPDAAWNVGSGRVGVMASDKPILVERTPISLFRESTWTRLSERALSGFIRRAESGNLKMPPGFLDALRAAPRAAPRRSGGSSEVR